MALGVDGFDRLILPVVNGNRSLHRGQTSTDRHAHIRQHQQDSACGERCRQQAARSDRQTPGSAQPWIKQFQGWGARLGSGRQRDPITVLQLKFPDPSTTPPEPVGRSLIDQHPPPAAPLQDGVQATDRSMHQWYLKLLIAPQPVALSME